MKKQSAIPAIAVAALLCWGLAQTGEAKIARGGGAAARPQVQNRSVNVNRPANINQGAGINRNVNVDRNVNRNIDRDVDIDVDRRGLAVVDDNDWGWGAFAAGAAIGATGAAVAGAVSGPGVVVVQPAVGTVVTTLPSAGCGAVYSGGVAIYDCGNVYYRPFYQGAGLVYQVVTYP